MQDTRFILIPDSVLKYSLKVNHLLLPIYLYSYVHRDIYTYNVDTNLQHITETFCPGADSRRGMPNKFAEVLNMLSDDVEDTYQGEERISGFSSFILESNFDFSDSNNIKTLKYQNNDKSLKYLDKGKRLIYNFYTGNMTHYISLSYQEYFTLVKASENDEILKLSPISVIEIINLYMYFKMQAYIYSNVYKQEYGRDFKPEEVKINNSNENIGKFMKIGARTVTMYANALEKIGLIDIGKEKNNKISGFKYVYKLSERYLEI